MEIHPIAHIHNKYTDLFGIPRQSGLTEKDMSRVVFEKEYSDPNAFREIEGYSHLWLIWQFDRSDKKEWTPTVRPPKLGGNKRVGVFASRSPYRPNSLGLSSVKLISVEYTDSGAVLCVSGADLADGTPIFDVKPYIPYSDSHPDANPGFSVGPDKTDYSVMFSENVKADAQTKAELSEILKLDPRPGYRNDGCVYKMSYGDKTVSFSISENVINVLSIC